MFNVGCRHGQQDRGLGLCLHLGPFTVVHSNKAWSMCEDRTLKFNFDNIYPSTANLHNSSFPVGVSSFLFGQIGQCHEI